MTPEARRTLVETPFPTINRIPGKSWAGLYIQDRYPISAGRAISTSPEDEDAWRLSCLEDSFEIPDEEQDLQ